MGMPRPHSAQQQQTCGITILGTFFRITQGCWFRWRRGVLGCGLGNVGEEVCKDIVHLDGTRTGTKTNGATGTVQNLREREGTKTC